MANTDRHADIRRFYSIDYYRKQGNNNANNVGLIHYVIK